MKMSVKDVARAARGKMIPYSLKNAKAVVTGVSTDTRTLKRGDLFVALRGERHDGHDHVAQAFEKGAVAAVVEKEAGSAAPLVVVKDSLKALGWIARDWRNRFDVPVVAVTGSNGKTTTKDMIAAVLNLKGPVLKTEGNFNNWIGLPQTLFKLEARFKKVVLEMGMNHAREIDWLARIASPEVGVVTHIGRAHIENFKNPFGIARAKGELLRRLPKKGLAVLNADDPYFDSLRKMTSARVVSFGFSPRATARLLSVEAAGLSKTIFRVKIAGKTTSFEIPLGGAHNAHNAAAAILVGRHYRVGLETMRDALKRYRPEKKRMEILRLARGIDVINDSYNANPDSMKAAIDYLKRFEGRRRVLVLGDMFELGKNAADYHREVGEYAGESGVDVLWAVGDRAADVREGALGSGMEPGRIFHAKDVDSALGGFLAAIRDGDLVLVKGSRGMKMERITEALVKEGAH